MGKKLTVDEFKPLFEAILSLKTEQECLDFFEDLCTINELMSMSLRYDVARRLKNELTYQEIAKETGASTATISRVCRSLYYGNDGYELVFARTPHQDEEILKKRES